MSNSSIKQYFSERKNSKKEEEERLKISKEIQNLKNKYKLNSFFKKLKIYVEIYNNNKEESNIFKEIIIDLGAIYETYLTKKVNYIIFKDGRLKTLKYALANKIKVVNPLWLDDKLNNYFNDDSVYEIKKNFTQINIEEGILKHNKLRISKSRRNIENIRKKKLSVRESLSFNSKYFVDNNNINVFQNKNNEKVKTISYNLSKEIINYLSGIESIEYKGNLTIENIKDKKNIYDECPVIFIRSDFEKYDYRLIKMLFQGKILVEVNIFISDNILKETQSKSKNISSFSLFYFEDLSINKEIKCLSKKKKSCITKIEEENNNIDVYYLDEGLEKGEYSVLKKVMKNYLKMKIIDLEYQKKRKTRSKSRSRTNVSNLQSKKPNTPVNDINNNKDFLNINVIQKENENDYKKVYIITTEKLKENNLTENTKKSILLFKGIISINFIYDSFYNKGIINMNDYFINN